MCGCSISKKDTAREIWKCEMSLCINKSKCERKINRRLITYQITRVLKEGPIDSRDKVQTFRKKTVHKFVFACILTLSFLNIFLSLWSQILYANCIVFKHSTKNLIRNQKEMLKVSKITEQVRRENLKATTKMKWEINEDERKKQSYIFLNLGNRKDIEQWCKSFF